jgi:hypothetical protein
MTKFSDQLYSDLMRDHGDTLARTGFPARSGGHPALRRGAWLAGGAGVITAGVVASLVTVGGGTARAYTVTPHSDGTVTVTITSASGVAGANAALRAAGDDQVVVVPVRPGCPSNATLRHPDTRTGSSYGSSRIGANGSDTITVDVKGIPKGALLMIAPSETGRLRQMGAGVIYPPAPSCVSLPAVGRSGGDGQSSSAARSGGGQSSSANG